MVERMIRGLQQAGKRDLLVFGYAFSSLIFTGEQDEDWLKGRFHFMEDILADTWVFQEIMHKGLTKGIAQGEAKGRMLEKKQDILQFVELRFPSLQTLAKQATERGYSLEQLQEILKQLYCATTVEEARKALHFGE
jgi:predicted transposase YdaD